jgi:Rieske 2Fe-2S family protein
MNPSDRGVPRVKEGQVGSNKVNRRAFTKASVAAGAAAVAFGKVLGAETPAAKSPAAGAATPSGGRAPADPPQGWREGTTIPGEYYVDPRHYENDERFLAEHFWLLVDHQSRIPKAGDYFVFEYGRGENVIILRNDSGGINAFHNVCRHRGSRLCRDDDDPRPGDRRLSVNQLGASGNTPLFRCPYHAWTYDLEGRLVQTYGMQKDFDPSKSGLIPVHLKVIQGHIFVNLSRKAETPDFKEDGDYLEGFGKQYGLADLKVAARRFYPIKANWKLAIENFLECYHCGPSHKSLVTTHNWDYSLSPEQRARRNREVIAWEGVDSGRPAAGQGGMGMGGGSADPEYLIGELNPGFLTGSLDGKPVAPLLPTIKDWTHRTGITTTSWSTGYWQAYDDHVMVARFTPRDVARTDCEMFWLVNPGAVEGKDYRPENVVALWDITIREDIWIVENNHLGVMSPAYGPGRYATHEDYPAGFIKWYMTEVVKA